MRIVNFFIDVLFNFLIHAHAPSLACTEKRKLQFQIIVSVTFFLGDGAQIQKKTDEKKNVYFLACLDEKPET